MSIKQITLELPNKVIFRAQQVAEQSNQTLEEVLSNWLHRYADDIPVETLSDDEVSALCDYEMNILMQQELSLLLHHHRERTLETSEQTRLDELLQIHRRGLIRKARAIQVAMTRGLLPEYRD